MVNNQCLLYYRLPQLNLFKFNLISYLFPIQKYKTKSLKTITIIYNLIECLFKIFAVPIELTVIRFYSQSCCPCV